MADSVTTQQADIKKLLAEAEAEAYEKLIAKAKAIIANSQLERAETPVDTPPAEPTKNEAREAHKKLLAEARAIIANSQLKREAEAHEKALAEANSQLKREARKKALAEPFLTTSQWLSVAIFIAASLARF